MSVQYPGARLLVFARTPAGEVKSRLAPVLSSHQRVVLHERLLENTLAQVSGGAWCPLELWCWADSDHPVLKDCAQRYSATRHTQKGSNLGARMLHAAARSLEEAAMVVLIGTDCPQMDADYVGQALRMLDAGADAVLGPAEDGGYVLLALRRVEAALFDGIDWGSDQVLVQTRQRLQSLGWNWHELPVLWDVDRPEDLQRLGSLAGWSSA